MKVLLRLIAGTLSCQPSRVRGDRLQGNVATPLPEAAWLTTLLTFQGIDL
jgi:hypothetical protein